MQFKNHPLYGAVKTAATLSLTLGLTAVSSFAASPVGNMLTRVQNEATSTWAVAGTITAAVLSGTGAAFGSHAIQEKSTKLLIGSSIALGAQALIYGLAV